MADKHEPLETSNRKTSDNKKDNSSEKPSYSLKGTFILVMLLGVFIILSWTTIYVIFISR